MDRSSSLRDLRSERISRSPYARPEQKARRPLHLSPVSALRSIVNYVTMPFKAPQSPTLPSTNQDLEASSSTQTRSRRRSLSESGSEDGWNGAPPAITNGNTRTQDIFSPPADAEREPTRDVRTVGLSLPSRFAPNGGPARSFASKSSTAAQAPTADGTAEDQGSSPSVAALTAFLNAKTSAGQPLRNQDYEVIDALTKSIKADSSAGTPARAAPRVQKLGGWSAGTFSTTPQQIKPLRRGETPSVFSTPQKAGSSSAPQTPGPIFSPGIASTPNSVSRGKVVYLGVGMSAKRKYGTPRAGIKPLFDPTEDELDTPAKKRRTEGQDEESRGAVPEVEGQRAPIPAVQSPSLQASTSSPALRSSTASVSSPLRQSLTASSSRLVRPSPLAQFTTSTLAQPTPSVTSSPSKADILAAAKRSASAILVDLIEKEEILLDEAPAQSVVINPYERSSAKKDTDTDLASSRTSAPGTPAKSAVGANLRASTSSPMRGAAAKMGSARGTKVSALERLSGKPAASSSSTPSKQSRARDSSTRDGRAAQVDVPLPPAVEDKQPESNTPAATTAEKRRDAEPAPEPFKPLYTPGFDTQSSKTSAPASAPSSSAQSYTPSFSFGTPSKPSATSAAPKFSTSFSLAKPEEETSILSDIKASSGPSITKRNADAVFLSAKDTALSVPAPALPFYTFTLGPSDKGEHSRPSESVKAAALKREVPVFSFSLSSNGSATTTISAPQASTSAPTQGFVFKPAAASTSAPKAASGADWTCSLCSCMSPSSAEKCVVCEEPKPSTASKPSFSSGFSVPTTAAASAAPTADASTSSAEWTCSLCSCKSPGSAQKCVVCEEPRPAGAPAPKPSAAPAASAAPAPPAFQPFTGFGAGFAPQKKTDQWTCSTCMCQNPESAKEKCQVCETPR